jgi:hypothetical protein
VLLHTAAADCRLQTKHFKRMKFLIPILFFATTVFSQTVPQKVLAYAKKNMGKKVDRGECWDLANAALNDAKANWKPLHDFGTRIELAKGKPGDVVQFTDVQFKFPNGSAAFPKHTAIIYAMKNKNLTLIHQNFNNKRYVDTITISLDYIVKGKTEAFRPN